MYHARRYRQIWQEDSQLSELKFGRSPQLGEVTGQKGIFPINHVD